MILKLENLLEQTELLIQRTLKKKYKNKNWTKSASYTKTEFAKKSRIQLTHTLILLSTDVYKTTIRLEPFEESF